MGIRGILALALVGICGSLAWATTSPVMDWQGGDRSLMDPTGWYEVIGEGYATYTTDPRTTHLPGTAETAFVRNVGSSTLDGTISCQEMRVLPSSSGTPSTMYVAPGGTLQTSSRLDIQGNIVQSGGLVNPSTSNHNEADTAIYVNGHYTMSGGSLVVKSMTGMGRLAIGYGGAGTFSMSDGQVRTATIGPSNRLEVGKGTIGATGLPSEGLLQISGGTFSTRLPSSNPQTRVGSDGGKGSVEVTGGLFDCPYLDLGYTTGATGSVGKLSLLGGTFNSTMLSVGFTQSGAVGRGEMVVNQHGAMINNSSLTFAPSASKLKVQIDSADPFRLPARTLSLGGDVEIALQGYLPDNNQEWLLFESVSINNNTTLTPASVSPGYRLESRSGDVYVIYDPNDGDANNDGTVNVGDLGILAGNWGQSGRKWGQGDFNGDGTVNVGDLGVLAGKWGWSAPTGGTPATSCDTPAVPEPLTLLTLAIALPLVRRRRH